MHNINIDNIRRKPLVWLGDSRKVIRGFPKEARLRAGQELLRAQERRTPKPDIEIGRNRFRQLMAERRTRWQTSSR